MLREVRFLCLSFRKIDLTVCERTSSISFDMALELLFKFYERESVLSRPQFILLTIELINP
jgi:hypothetical protein